MKYIIKYLFVSMVLLSAITLFLLSTTQKGLVLEVQYISRLVPGDMKIETVSGTLFSHFSLQNISYRYAGYTMTLQALDVRWHPSKLLMGKLDFDTLAFKNATLQLPEETVKNHLPIDKSAQQPAETPSTTDWNTLRAKLKLLRFIHVRQLIFEKISVYKGNQLFQLQGKLDDTWNIQWTLQAKLKTAITQGFLQGTGNITGPRLTPAITAFLHGKQLTYQQYKVAAITAEAHVILQPGQNSTLKVRASGIHLNDDTFKALSLDSTGTITYEKKTLTAALQLHTADRFNLAMTIHFPHFSGWDDLTQPIAGNIHFTALDLGILTKWVPDIKNPQGKLEGNVVLQGTLEKPEYKLTAALTHGSVAFPLLGLHLTPITAQGEMDHSLHLAFTGQFQSGKGSARLQGSEDLSQANFPLTLTLDGENLQIVNLPEYKVEASPHLSLLFAYPALELQGSLHVLRAEMTPKDFSTAVTLPDEVVFVNPAGQPAPATTSPIALKLRMDLSLGDNVKVNYSHLKAKLLGSIMISKAPDSPAQASGELYTPPGGTYTAYGKKLTIETGRLIYTGNPLTNPGLNIRAVKQVRRIVTQATSSFTANTPSQTVPGDTETLTVGVQVTGTADKPRISLFSVPAGLSQADILSYILLGLPQSQASSAQGSILLTALSAYNPETSQVLGITETLQKTLGLNQLDVESVETFNPATQSVESTTAFVIGKQITQKLSIHYSIGLFNPVSILNLRYQISKHWSIQSETSTIDSGADLLYGFERD